MIYELWAWTGFIVWATFMLSAALLLVYLTLQTLMEYCWRYRVQYRFAIHLLFNSKGMMHDPYTVKMPNGKTYRFTEVDK